MDFYLTTVAVREGRAGVLPASVRVNGLTYKVTVKSRAQGQDTYGMFDQMVQAIDIRGDLTPALQARTLLHECIEAINANYELKLDHHAIDLLEAGLWCLFQDNPELIKLWGRGYD